VRKRKRRGYRGRERGEEVHLEIRLPSPKL